MNVRRAILLVVVVCVFSSVAVGQPWDGNGVEGDELQTSFAGIKIDGK